MSQIKIGFQFRVKSCIDRLIMDKPTDITVKVVLLVTDILLKSSNLFSNFSKCNLASDIAIFYNASKKDLV